MRKTFTHKQDKRGFYTFFFYFAEWNAIGEMETTCFTPKWANRVQLTYIFGFSVHTSMCHACRFRFKHVSSTFSFDDKIASVFPLAEGCYSFGTQYRYTNAFMAAYIAPNLQILINLGQINHRGTTPTSKIPTQIRMKITSTCMYFQGLIFFTLLPFFLLVPPRPKSWFLMSHYP